MIYNQMRDISLGIGQRSQDIQVTFECRGAKGCGLNHILLGEHFLRHSAVHRARPHQYIQSFRDLAELQIIARPAVSIERLRRRGVGAAVPNASARYSK